MAQQGIDAALIACNVNLLYTYGEIVNGYLYLPLHSPALLFVNVLIILWENLYSLFVNLSR